MYLAAIDASVFAGQRSRIVVAGGGAAGWAAADELRRLGFAGEVLAFGAEPVHPYDRTACSKGLLDGTSRPRDVWLSRSDCADVDWRLGCRLVHLVPAAKIVVTDTGDRYSYDGLVIATGARAVAPRAWPRQPSLGAHVLRNLADAGALRRDLRDANRVAIVGGGLTGCEVASVARDMARQVTIVHSSPTLMSRALGEPVGRLVTSEFRSAGIDVQLGVRARRVQRCTDSWHLCLDNGVELEADLVIAATGERPEVDWLANSGLDISDGVACDSSMRVVGARDVVAAGAVARWPNPLNLGRSERIGHWTSAIEQGQAAARALLYPDALLPSVGITARFSTEQLGMRIEVCGHLDPNADIQLAESPSRKRDSASTGVTASYFRAGRLVGVSAVNAPRAFALATRALLPEQAA